MLKKNVLRFFVAIVISSVLVSYFERPQIQFFMPLRDWLYVPQETAAGTPDIDIPDGMPYKSSKEGYYVNPWLASQVVSDIGRTILQRGSSTVKSEDLQKILEFAAYFVESAEIRKKDSLQFACWPYPIHFMYGLRPGWISGMAQGNIALVLAAASRCAERANAELFLQYAELALNSFEVKVENGGILVIVDGGYWYEEYAQQGVKPPLVLNGHIYAVQALKALKDFDTRAEGLYRAGIEAVVANIHHYDAVTWSYYDRTGIPANNIYQQPLHARQMKELHDLIGKEIFLEYHNRFSIQRLSPFSAVQRLVKRPTRFLSFLLVVNTLIFFFILIGIGYIFNQIKKRKK